MGAGFLEAVYPESLEEELLGWEPKVALKEGLELGRGKTIYYQVSLTIFDESTKYINKCS